LLEPFALLDEMARRPETEPRPPDELGPYFDVVMQSWREHRLPVIPGLGWCAVRLGLVEQPVVGQARGWGAGARARRAVRRMVVSRTAQGACYRGDLVVVEPGAFTLLPGQAVRLHTEADHTGTRLEVELPPIGGADAIALVPALQADSPSEPCRAAWVGALARHGLVAITLPSGRASAAVEPGLTLRVTLRVQEAEVALLAASGALLSHGKADLGYVRPPRARPSRR
jgi:hypothetical protein